jgi:hypothetical protein
MEADGRVGEGLHSAGVWRVEAEAALRVVSEKFLGRKELSGKPYFRFFVFEEG